MGGDATRVDGFCGDQEAARGIADRYLSRSATKSPEKVIQIRAYPLGCAEKTVAYPDLFSNNRPNSVLAPPITALASIEKGAL